MLKLMLLSMLLTVGCATKIRVPLNRMISPESVGGAMNPEFEFGQQGQANGKIDTSASSPYPIKVSEQRASSYFFGLSFFESLDFTWNHTASAPSLVGVRWQFLGNSLRSAGAGHSMAMTAAFGGNEHEVEGSPKLEFDISAYDVSLIHGYWITPWWQVFESLAYTSYSIEGKLSGTPSGEISDSNKQLTAAAGTAVVMAPFKVKTELAYSQLDWSDSKDESFLSWALSLGFFF
jgi:hypothetical protein